MADLRDLVSEILPQASVLVPPMAYRRAFSTTPSVKVVAAVVAEIDRQWRQAPERFDRIWIVGHSLGSVIARKVVLTALGAAPDVDGGNLRHDWAHAIDRLVFLAAVNRGWTPTSALGWAQSTAWSLGVLFGELFLLGRCTVFDVRRGAPFLTETRMQWLHLSRRDPAILDRVEIVQIVGTLDDIVAPDSVVDFEIDDVSRSKVHLLEAPQTGHLDAIRLSATGSPGEDAVRATRRRVVATSFADLAAIEAAEVPIELLSDVLPPDPDLGVEDVVFVMHGIRDKGFWTQKIAREVRRVAAASGRKIRTVTETYGYLTMLPFLVPWIRRAKVEWFADQYVDLVARYPRARFHYIGHSNGTYLLARALRDYPSMRVEQVVFAGSVVRSDYDWASLLPRGRNAGKVRKVMNYVASGDWVVAVFPKGLEGLPYFDLGGAGHSGFGATEGVDDLRYIRGGHGAGIRETHWDEIAEFIVNGRLPSTAVSAGRRSDFVRHQSKFWRIIGITAPLPFLVIIAVIIAIPVAGTWAAVSLDAMIWLVVGLILYAWILRTIVLRL